MFVCVWGGVKGIRLRSLNMGGAPESPLSTGPERPRYATALAPGKVVPHFFFL